MLPDPEEFGLGQLPSLDPRNKLFLMEDILQLPSVKPNTSREWRMSGHALNQKNTGTCVGHAGKHWLISDPDPEGTPTGDPTAFKLYEESCLNDEYGDNDDTKAPDFLQYGSSIHGLMKAFVKRKAVKGSYVWAYDSNTVAQWVVNHSPVILGIAWDNNMFYPDGGNKIHFGGGRAGGHAIVAVGYYAPWDDFIILSSWGNWGHDGRVLFNSRDLDERLRNGGEAAAATRMVVPGRPV